MDLVWISLFALFSSIIFIVRMFAILGRLQNDDEGDRNENNDIQRNGNQLNGGVEFEPEDPFARYCPISFVSFVPIIIVIVSVLVALPLFNNENIETLPDCPTFCESPLRQQLCYSGYGLHYCCSLCDPPAAQKNISEKTRGDDLNRVPLLYRQFGGNVLAGYQYLADSQEIYNASSHLENNWSLMNKTSLLDQLFNPKYSSKRNWMSALENAILSKFNIEYSQRKTGNNANLSPQEAYIQDLEERILAWIYIVSCVSFLITITCLGLLYIIINFRDDE